MKKHNWVQDDDEVMVCRDCQITVYIGATDFSEIIQSECVPPVQEESKPIDFGEITLMGRLCKDPESRMLAGAKVAVSQLAHNASPQETDFWYLEVWSHGENDSKHDYLVNYGAKGKKVLIKGKPSLKLSKYNDEYRHYPTVRVTEIIYLEN